MRRRSGRFSTFILPGDTRVPPKLPPPAWGLIDATSNAGGVAGVCAWLRGGVGIPTATGITTAVMLSRIFLAEFRFRAMGCVRSGMAISICNLLFVSLHHDISRTTPRISPTGWYGTTFRRCGRPQRPKARLSGLVGAWAAPADAKSAPLAETSRFPPMARWELVIPGGICCNR
jgi:hypothetical protein